MTPVSPVPFGLWELVRERPFIGHATTKQVEAGRYVIGDMPTDAQVGFDVASDLLAVRSYVIGLLDSLYRRGIEAHPREAMWWVVREASRDPLIFAAIRRWSRNRYNEDRGPASVGATRYFDELSRVAIENCRAALPSEIENIAVRNAALRACGLGRLISAASPTIHYRNGGEVTVRMLSDVVLSSRWPWWAYWLIKAPTFISVEAFCHFRNEQRTFSASNIQHAG
jgi:hypothetical protein